jgi:hypothetical protein
MTTYKPGMVVYYWCHGYSAFVEGDVARIRASLPAHLGIRYDYGNKWEAFYRIHKKTGAERAMTDKMTAHL